MKQTETMLLSASNLLRSRLAARDGEMGRVRDFLFDDRTWAVRYLVADTGTWLPDRQVLIAPSALGQPEPDVDSVHVNLTRDQIKDGPPLALDAPVSAQMEIDLHSYYGWPPYWARPEAHGRDSLGRPAGVDDPTVGDSSLRSLQEVKGYDIQATDGAIGHVEDAILEVEDWWLRYMVVDTRNWLPGRKVLISPEWIRSIRWADGNVHVEMTRDRIQASPEYDPALPVNRAYEEKLYDFYGRPRYWAAS
jgi:hypothetical protein